MEDLFAASEMKKEGRAKVVGNAIKYQRDPPQRFRRQTAVKGKENLEKAGTQKEMNANVELSPRFRRRDFQRGMGARRVEPKASIPH